MVTNYLLHVNMRIALEDYYQTLDICSFDGVKLELRQRPFLVQPRAPQVNDNILRLPRRTTHGMLYRPRAITLRAFHLPIQAVHSKVWSKRTGCSRWRDKFNIIAKICEIYDRFVLVLLQRYAVWGYFTAPHTNTLPYLLHNSVGFEEDADDALVVVEVVG